MPKTHFSARIFSRFGHARRGMRRAAAAAAALLMLLCAALPAYAEGAENADTGYALPDGVTIDAESAILVSLGSTAEQDAVLFGRDADGVHAPGSMIRFAVVAYALSRVEETGRPSICTSSTTCVSKPYFSPRRRISSALPAPIRPKE